MGSRDGKAFAVESIHHWLTQFKLSICINICEDTGFHTKSERSILGIIHSDVENIEQDDFTHVVFYVESEIKYLGSGTY